MLPDLWTLYALMLKSRLFEELIARLWKDGLISGEMHLGTGEEAIMAGIVAQLRNDDALALDHRGTSALLMRGVDPGLILRELLGRTDGLCGGWGGHMHLFSKEHLAASSGIVGSAGPAAAGLALAARYLRPGAIAVAFFGDGAMNQGVLLEAMNLAFSWCLPVLFVCKDDHWAITTQSSQVSGGSPIARARSLGLSTVEANGKDVSQVWQAAHQAMEHIRSGQGPVFMCASCVHLEAHFLGYPLLRAIRDPFGEMPGIAGPLVRSLMSPGGAPLRERLAGLGVVTSAVLDTLRDPRQKTANDPVAQTRTALQSDAARLQALEDATKAEVDTIGATVAQEELA